MLRVQEQMASGRTDAEGEVAAAAGEALPPGAALEHVADRQLGLRVDQHVLSGLSAETVFIQPRNIAPDLLLRKPILETVAGYECLALLSPAVKPVCFFAKLAQS